ncbi:MAG: hypothetical protein AB1916_12120 [Thermodesulfobacteriota bacterium]
MEFGCEYKAECPFHQTFKGSENPDIRGFLGYYCRSRRACLECAHYLSLRVYKTALDPSYDPEGLLMLVEA